ncbi:DUF3592 domain-containing protein [Plantactinospora veratri]|uniref:DUF3592 domain-containing protein n=1 Tax=Plantactinospora veratri TaxID=1436122 RepID=A0ABU7SDS7_9ACTN
MLAAVLGGVGYTFFDRLATQRITGGVAVDAEVTAVQAIPVQRIDLPQVVTVSYRFEGTTRSARLVAPLFAGSHRVGDVLTVYLLPDRPQQVATRDGLASEGLILLVPPATVFYGVACLVVIGASRLAWWLRHGRAGPQSVPALTVNGLVETSDRLRPWSRAIERLRVTAAAESAGTGAGLRMHLVYRVSESISRRRPTAPRVVWHSRRRGQMTIEAWVQATEDADAETEVVHILQQALRLAESSAPSRGTSTPVSGLGRVVQRTVESYQRR